MEEEAKQVEIVLSKKNTRVQKLNYILTEDINNKGGGLTSEMPKEFLIGPSIVTPLF